MLVEKPFECGGVGGDKRPSTNEVTNLRQPGIVVGWLIWPVGKHNQRDKTLILILNGRTDNMPAELSVLISKRGSTRGRMADSRSCRCLGR